MATALKVDLKLYKTDGFHGYDSGDLDKWLKENNLFDRWSAWSKGQTVAVLKDDAVPRGERTIVYKHDVEQFLSGKMPLD